MFKRFVFMGISFFGLTAHGWYDPECCSDQHCEVVQVLRLENGYEFFKDGKVWATDKDTFIKLSKDDKSHGCVYQNRVVCLYLATGS